MSLWYKNFYSFFLNILLVFTSEFSTPFLLLIVFFFVSVCCKLINIICKARSGADELFYFLIGLLSLHFHLWMRALLCKILWIGSCLFFWTWTTFLPSLLSCSCWEIWCQFDGNSLNSDLVPSVKNFRIFHFLSFCDFPPHFIIIIIAIVL